MSKVYAVFMRICFLRREKIAQGIFILLFVAISNLHALGNTVQQAAERDQQEILVQLKQTLDLLGEIRVAAGDADIPPVIRPLLTDLKHELRDLILCTLNDKTYHWETPQELQNHVLSILQRNNTPVEEYQETSEEDARDNYSTFTYDIVRAIQIEKASNHPDSLVVMTELGVMCGVDTSFYYFQKTGEKWVLKVAQEENDYEEISSAQLYFDYAISSIDNNGQFFFVTANTSPWCTSAWRTIRYRVFRIGATPYQPSILLQEEELIYGGCWPDSYNLTVQSNTFRLEFSSDSALGSENIHSNRLVIAYEVLGDQLTRIPPLALNPAYFLDAWFDLPWEDAVKWTSTSSSSSLTTLGFLHENVRANRMAEKELFRLKLLFVHPSGKDQTQWQIGLSCIPSCDESSLSSWMPERLLFFKVSQKKGRYVVEGVFNGCSRAYMA